jgi:chromosomal replication initiation ATPase DnaA
VSPDPSLTVIDPPLTVKEASSFFDWPKILTHLRGRMEPRAFDSLLHGTTAERRNGRVTIYVKGEAARQNLEHRQRRNVEGVVADYVGEPVEIEFVVKDAKGARP